VLAALRVSGGYLARCLIGAIILGVLVGLAFATNWSNTAWTTVGNNAFTGAEAGVRPLVAAVVVGGLVLGVHGFLAGISGGLGRAFLGFVDGLVLGVVIGALSAISFSRQVGAAIGVAVAVAAWPALGALALRNYDWAALKDRFMPTTTIETSRETIEWLHQIQQRIRPARPS